MVLSTLCKSSKRVSTTYYIFTTTAACSRRNCPIGKYWSVKRGIGENLVTQLIVSKRVFCFDFCQTTSDMLCTISISLR